MIDRSPTLRRVLDNDLCSGCGLCEGLSDGAIAMNLDRRGYVRPVQSAPITPEAERGIAFACPGAAVAEWSTSAPNVDSFWGPWFESLTGYATDADTRFTGASGGALSALATHALDTGLVDRVLHIEADPEEPTGNRLRISTSREDVISGAGSRYAASAPLAAIQTALDAPGKFAFIGKPCDVSALRRYARLDSRVEERVPLMLSFFCGGMPSRHGVTQILRTMGLDPDEIVRFRYRGNGWPGLTVAETGSGDVRTMSYHDSWGNHLSNDLQFRCKICPDAVGAVADVACADAWYGDDGGYPNFEEADGRSLLLTRTDVGQRLLRSAIEHGAIAVEPLPIAEIERMQPSQANRKRAVAARTAACRTALRAVPKMRGVEVHSARRRAPMLSQAKNYLGMLRRLLLKRAPVR